MEQYAGLLPATLHEAELCFRKEVSSVTYLYVSMQDLFILIEEIDILQFSKLLFNKLHR
jgi:hypothetical protein